MDIKRQAERLLSQKKWSDLEILSRRLIEADEAPSFGHFLKGVIFKSRGDLKRALENFELAIKIDRNNQEAAVEAADTWQRMGRHAKAIAMLPEAPNKAPDIERKIGDIYSRAGLHAKATSPYKRANEMDAESSLHKFNLAGNLSKTGAIDQARSLYLDLLGNYPDHQRMHYELAKLSRATNDEHFSKMRVLLEQDGTPDEKNIFLLFALGKAAEDLGKNDTAFSYYARGNKAAAGIAMSSGYKVEREIAVLDSIAQYFTTENLTGFRSVQTSACPIFIVGLPRSGTTLTEKILTGHGDIESIDESFFLENSVKAYCGLGPKQSLTPAHVQQLANSKDSAGIIENYLAQSEYRRLGKSNFIEKYPLNFLFTGLISRHLPQAKFICLLRNPMDVCFALFKQPHFRFALDLEDLGKYFGAFERLKAHWQETIGSQLLFLRYENLVEAPEKTVQEVMAFLDLEYSSELLNFHERRDVSASASSSQIREKLYSRSIGKWKTWETELAPLKAVLEQEGITLS